MKSDGLFFLGVIAFFFILWFATGGPTRPMSFAGPYITPITDVGTVSSGYGSGSTEGFVSNGSIWSNIMGIENQVADLQRNARHSCVWRSVPVQGSNHRGDRGHWGD